jgi:cytosine/adenosine deaminase-related metal-dependent hydrolase
MAGAFSRLSRAEGTKMSGDDPVCASSSGQTAVVTGARLSAGPDRSFYGSIEIAGERIAQIVGAGLPMHLNVWPTKELDLSGYLVLPGLINGHDHLEFSLYPRLADPPYRNYVEWGDDIHRKFACEIARQHTVPKRVRLQWGGVRNLLSGVTTVCHHNPLWPELNTTEFPIRVVTRYGWAHSIALGGDLFAARAATAPGQPFIVHACEGTDALAQSEVRRLEESGLLDEYAVLVHGLAIDLDGAALIKQRRASLIVCPSSNFFLYGRLPNLELLDIIEQVALGSDSPLTAAGDLPDEIRFATSRWGLSPSLAYRMVTTSAASLLRLENGEGSIKVSGRADLIAVRDSGQTPAGCLPALSAADIELVMIGGRIQLASEEMLRRLPIEAKRGLEPIAIGEIVRWLRVPVNKLIGATEAVLGNNAVQLTGRNVTAPALDELSHVR